LSTKIRSVINGYLIKLKNDEIKQKTELAMSNEYKKIAKAHNPGQVQSIKDNTWDVIMTVVSVGAIAYGLSSSGYSSGAQAPSSAPPNPWFDWGQGFGNPLNLPQIPL
jgi:hypothetical protein